MELQLETDPTQSRALKFGGYSRLSECQNQGGSAASSLGKIFEICTSHLDGNAPTS